MLKTVENLNSLSIIRNVLLNHQRSSFCSQMIYNIVIAFGMNGMVFSYLLIKLKIKELTLQQIKERMLVKEELEVDITSAVLISLQHHLDNLSVVKSALIAVTTLIGFLGKNDLD